MIIRTASMQPTMQRYFASHGEHMSYRDYLLKVMRGYWPNANPQLSWEPGGKPLKAEIGSSNWRVRCDVCSEIIIYEPGEVFICPQCANSSNSYRARNVLMPDNRAEIENILLQRPDPQTRDWFPNETVEQLLAENAFRSRALAAGLVEREALAIMDMCQGDIELAEQQLDTEINARKGLTTSVPTD